MSVNRFAAHYMLSPRGELLKWPVVSILDDGCIESVSRFKNGFKEQPFTRFYAGILCPAFIDVYLDVTAAGISLDKLSLNRHFRDGTLCLGVKEAINPELVLTSLPQLIQFSSEENDVPEQNIFSGNGTLLERMKNQTNDQISLAESLSIVTARASALIGISGLGKLEEGCTPGLLLLQNVDLVNLKWTSRSTVKWLNVPNRTAH